MAIVKVVLGVVAVLLLVAGCGVLATMDSLRDPPFDPPALAPLGPDAPFRADRIAEGPEGYAVAGVLGTSDPLRGRPCSGRFAVVLLDVQGRAQRAAVLTDLERGNYCADRVDELVPAPDGGWLVAATGVRDGGPSALFPGKPSTDSQRVTFRLDENGTLVESFGRSGAVRNHHVAGRVDGAFFTDRLERMAEDGSVHDDLVDSEKSYWRWRELEVADDEIVAIGYGRDLTFQTFERDAPEVPVYRPLHPDPAVPGDPTIDLGDVRVVDTMLLGRRLFVVVDDGAGTRINAVDAWRPAIDFAFNGTGAVRLRDVGYVSSAKLGADREGRIVVAFTAIDRGIPGDRLHVRRLLADGAWDDSFGGPVTRNGGDLVLDPGVRDAFVDAAGRTLVLGDAPISRREAPAVLARLDSVGTLDGTFADAGVVPIRGLRPCDLLPARRHEVCRTG